MSARSAAIAELKTRLSGITVAGGYATDAGLTLFVGEHPVLGPDDPDSSVALLVGDEDPKHQGENVVSVLSVVVAVVVKADSVDPWTSVEAVLSDVRKAVETDHSLGGVLIPRGLERGPTKSSPREAGGEFVGVEAEYSLMLSEGWGTP